MTRLAVFLRRNGAAFRLAVLIAASATAVVPARAQFSLAVSPPRFELSVKPGEQVREVIELTHSDVRAGAYKLKTADWTLRPDGSVDFSDELLPGSCRPWVAIERRVKFYDEGAVTECLDEALAIRPFRSPRPGQQAQEV